LIKGGDESNTTSMAEYVLVDLVVLRLVADSEATISMLGGWPHGLVSDLASGLIIFVHLAVFLYPLQVFLVSSLNPMLLSLLAPAFPAARIAPTMKLLIAVIISLTRDWRTIGMGIELVELEST